MRAHIKLSLQPNCNNFGQVLLWPCCWRDQVVAGSILLMQPSTMLLKGTCHQVVFTVLHAIELPQSSMLSLTCNPVIIMAKCFVKSYYHIREECRRQVVWQYIILACVIGGLPLAPRFQRSVFAGRETRQYSLAAWELGRRSWSAWNPTRTPAKQNSTQSFDSLCNIWLALQDCSRLHILSPPSTTVNRRKIDTFL